MKRRFIENKILGYIPPDPDVENYKDLIQHCHLKMRRQCLQHKIWSSRYKLDRCLY